MAKTAAPAKKSTRSAAIEPVRTGTSVECLKQAIQDHLCCTLGRMPSLATRSDWYTALALAARDRLHARSVDTIDRIIRQDSRVVAYLSAEFLPGPHTANNLLSLGMLAQAREACRQLGCDLDALLEQEEEPGLGNGGLGRLASCYMDSLAALHVPAVGYGIRYEFGIFDQTIQDGWQTEITDKWLAAGNVWELARPDVSYEVPFGGHTEHHADASGRPRVRWVPDSMIRGIAYDTPILGFGGGTCNRLRLWSAQAIESFSFAAFNHGDYYRAVEDKMNSENLTKVLYPNDEVAAGKLLRLKQQVFFVSCSLQDMIRMFLLLGRPLKQFHAKFAAQMNDTHPAIAVAELMRLLVDQHDLEWDEAWQITQATLAYTNHTLLPEALETWPVEMFARLLPRHLEIIYEINRRFLEQVRGKWPGDDQRVVRMSLIDEAAPRSIRMASLASVGSHRINGVAQLHSDLLRKLVLRDFAELWPDKFCNVTNGVTPRRFVVLSNPPLAQLITDAIGEGWIADLGRLRKLEALADDASFQKQWRQVKLQAKSQLAALIAARTGIEVDPGSLFDVQVKRIHEYKRQHLNALHVLCQYLKIRNNPRASVVPRTFIFGGKAAPGYHMAKLIIKLINDLGTLINQDRAVKGRLKVVFFPDFNVKNAQFIYPAADLSEQISTAGKEASGTGNMKFAMNGALTIGTLDGANVEIREHVGSDHFFLFGLDVDQVHERQSQGYNPREHYDRDPLLRQAIDFIASGALSRGDPSIFRPLVDSLLNQDRFMVLADFAAYIKAQSAVTARWRDEKAWTRASILNTARMGYFSSDRSIRDYCRQVWSIKLPD
jgi:starch phosphorylase